MTNAKFENKDSGQTISSGMVRKIGIVEVLLEMVFSASHVCYSNLGHHSRGRGEVTLTFGMFCQMGKSTRNQSNT